MSFISQGLEYLQHEGCSPFFISGALSSSVFGEMARNEMGKNSKEGLKFKEKLFEVQQQFGKEMLDVEILAKRENMELGRLYQQIETQKSFENAEKRQEVEFFVKKELFPLTYTIETILDRVQNIGNALPQLSIIVAKSNVPEISGDYHNNCAYLSEWQTEIPNIDLMRNAWKQSAKAGSVAQNMNVHYVMQGLPTLIITPKKLNDQLFFDASVWNYRRGLGSLIHLSMFNMPYDDTYDKLKDKIRLAQLAVMGIVRDSFMMLEFHQLPCLPHALQKEQKKLDEFPELKQFIVDEYRKIDNNIQKQPEYKELCTGKEWSNMQHSIRESIQIINR
jgi:hypothetical protein